MKTIKLFLLVVAMFLGFGTAPIWAKDGVLFRISAEAGAYCHLKFPAIREDTLSWNSPVLKDATDGDIIDFYGPCDYDPHGKDAIQAQKRSQSQRIGRDND